MLITTVIFLDGEERQFPAASVTVGAPQENLIRVDLATDGKIIIPLSAVREIHTRDLPEEAISPEVTGTRAKY